MRIPARYCHIHCIKANSKILLVQQANDLIFENTTPVKNVCKENIYIGLDYLATWSLIYLTFDCTTQKGIPMFVYWYLLDSIIEHYVSNQIPYRKNLWWKKP